MNALLQIPWSWHPTLVIGFGLITLIYIGQVRRSHAASLTQQITFHIGTLLGLLALTSPLDKLGDEYLFSAHMLQHLLLMFVTAPLWLVGMPGQLADKLIPRRLERLANRLASPVPAFIVFVGFMYFWHIPSMYEMTLHSEAIHIVEHLSFIGAALVGWWPVAGSESSRLSKPYPPLRMLYLFLLAFPCTGMAAILTFASQPLYPFYITVPHIFGLDALQDQHLGGLLMWLPTHMILLLALGITFMKWLSSSDRQEELNFR